ncbi:MAG TPA: chemotaxis protein CheW [Solimonas sp.]|nr:chemotaxis protein CheW [Solimonas sp.]
MSAELRSLRDDPFELLLLLETRLRATRLDIAAGQAESWTGLGFRIGRNWLAAPKEDVREVIVPPRPTRVPNAKPWLTGIANVRGELLTIVDLRRLLGVEGDGEGRAQRVLVLNSERIPAGFLVDEVAGYRQFSPGEQRHEMKQGSGGYEPFLLGAFVRDGQPWLALSLHKVIQSGEFIMAGI